MSPMRTPRETLQRRRQPWSSRLKRSRRHCLTKLELHLSHSPPPDGTFRAHIIASEQLVYLSDCSIACGLIVSEHWMHFAELITLRHPIPPPTKLASAQGGRGSQTRNCIGVTLCTSSSPSSNSSNSSTCTSSCIGITLSASLQFSSANM